MKNLSSGAAQTVTASMDVYTFPGMIKEGIGIGCYGHWIGSNHMLFQLAHGALLIAFLAPNNIYGTLFLHSMLVLGFLLLSTWAWVAICAPDIFSWNFSFMVINSVQMLFMMYRLRPIKLSPELEELYDAVFLPLQVTKQQFKKLVSAEYSTIVSLHQGEPYARQNITKTDRLGILIQGTAKVVCNGQLLHHVHEKQFLDSPEFEAAGQGDERFQVSIISVTPCYAIYWTRQALNYLFVKEPFLSTIMSTITGRDITNKLYVLNDKLRDLHGSRLDIRLPSISTVAFSSKSDVRSPSIREDPDAGEEAEGDGEDAYEECTEETRMFPNGTATEPPVKPKIRFTFSGGSSTSP